MFSVGLIVGLIYGSVVFEIFSILIILLFVALILTFMPSCDIYSLFSYNPLS